MHNFILKSILPIFLVYFIPNHTQEQPQTKQVGTNFKNYPPKEVKEVLTGKWRLTDVKTRTTQNQIKNPYKILTLKKHGDFIHAFDKGTKTGVWSLHNGMQKLDYG